MYSMLSAVEKQVTARPPIVTDDDTMPAAVARPPDSGK
jgi:hypothetical protein